MLLQTNGQSIKVPICKNHPGIVGGNILCAICKALIPSWELVVLTPDIVFRSNSSVLYVGYH